MRQLRRWKRLWRRSLTHSHKSHSMGPSRSCWHGTTSALQLEEITSKGTRVSSIKVPIRKKSGNLFNDPRMCMSSCVSRSVYVQVSLCVSVSVSMSMCVNMFLSVTYVCVSVGVCVCTFISMCICVCVYVYVSVSFCVGVSLCVYLCVGIKI